MHTEKRFKIRFSMTESGKFSRVFLAKTALTEDGEFASLEKTISFLTCGSEVIESAENASAVLNMTFYPELEVDEAIALTATQIDAMFTYTPGPGMDISDCSVIPMALLNNASEVWGSSDSDELTWVAPKPM